MSAHRKRAFPVLDPRSAPTRVAISLLAGVATWLALPADLPLLVRLLVAWNAASFVLLAIASVIIMRASSDETRRRAAAYDPGRALVWVIVVAASAVSLLAAILVLRHKGPASIDKDLLLVLCIATVALAWLLTHVGFALRYAHLYYRGGPSDEGGLVFPGESPPDPDDMDFVYYSFTIGMCFQTSDVSVTDRAIRRTTLLHSLISFLYNTGILAFSINVVVGQLN